MQEVGEDAAQQGGPRIGLLSFFQLGCLATVAPNHHGASIMRLVRATALIALLVACSGDPASPRVIAFETTIAGDTVGAAPQLVTVSVSGAGVGVAVTLDAYRTQPSGSAFARFSRDGVGPGMVPLTDTTDANGKVSVWMHPGWLADTGYVVAATGGISTRADFRLRPGNATHILITPGDTALYTGRSYVATGVAADRFSNRRADVITFSSPDSSISVTTAGMVQTTALGRARVLATVGAITDTAWVSVVPHGRIFAYRPWLGTGDTSSLVMVDLDGSNYRNFPAPSLVSVIAPAWHPSGSWVAYWIPVGSASRLVKLDTTTGVTVQLVPSAGAPYSELWPQFSHDGNWLYFSWQSVYRLSLSTNQLDSVGFDQGGISFGIPSPSPTGDSIAVQVQASSGEYFYVYPSTAHLGSSPLEYPFVDSLPHGKLPRWSPTQNEILLHGDEGLSIMQPGVPGRRILAGQYAVQMHITGGFSGASWSSDGQWIVARAAQALILIHVPSGDVLPLPFGSRLTYPAWRP